METKVCNRCGQELPIDEFYQVPSMKANIDNTCKNCRRELRVELELQMFYIVQYVIEICPIINS